MPSWPRGPRKKQRALEKILLGCPRISPEWELSTLTALMRPKPATREAVEHRTGDQPFSPELSHQLLTTAQKILHRLQLDMPLHVPEAGEFFFIADIPPELVEPAKALAIGLSLKFPDHWFVLGRLFIRNGVFHRRRRAHRLELIKATDVHLKRGLRAKLLREV